MVCIMGERRSGETDTRTYFRTDRMVKENGQWFFTTREATIHGPFQDRHQAHKELMEYIKIMQERQKGNLTLTPRAPLFSG